MVKTVVGEKVINKLKEKGEVISVNDRYLEVDFGNRIAKLQLDAFEKGFLKYENATLQNEVDEKVKQIKNEEERKKEEARLIAEEKLRDRRLLESKAPLGTRFEKISVRLDPAPLKIVGVKKKRKELLQEIFSECDKDTRALYENFDPQFDYKCGYKISHCVGFVVKYADIYVIRVFERTDRFGLGDLFGITVKDCTITEEYRAVFLEGNVYYFRKYSYKKRGGNKGEIVEKWKNCGCFLCLTLDKVIRKCDCHYLNDYIEMEKINGGPYIKLLGAALYSNKAEIAFKEGMFWSFEKIQNVAEFLEEFSHKQIVFACMHDVINALPFIKRHGLYDVHILENLEEMASKHRLCTLMQFCRLLNISPHEMEKRLIRFLKGFQSYNLGTYEDYLCMLRGYPDVTVKDLFDKNFRERHDIMAREIAKKREEGERKKREKEEKAYTQEAEKLSWIDRVEKGYYFIVPKTIDDMKYEGDQQHICVYSARYYNKVIAHQSIIVFLRKKEDTPYVTIEFDYNTFELLQVRGKFNSEVDYALKEYVVNLGQRLYKERCNLKCA